MSLRSCTRLFTVIGNSYASNLIQRLGNGQCIRSLSTDQLSQQKKSIPSTLRYRIIRPEEFTSEFEDLVLRRFLFEEPMSKHLGITASDECLTLFIRQVLEKAQQDQVSLGYYDEKPDHNQQNSNRTDLNNQNKIEQSSNARQMRKQKLPVCFVINHIENVDDPPEMHHFDMDIDKARIEYRDKYQCIGGILTKITENYDIFKEYKARRMMHSFLAGIESAYAKQGLFTRLKVASIELARQKNCDLIYSKATSQFSTQANLKLGYHKVRTVDYSAYTNEKGEHVFNGMSKTHQSCTLTVKDLRV